MAASLDRIAVTGGAGFLGSAVVRQLQQRGHQHVVAVRRRDYDLTREADVERMYAELRPTVLIHAAAEVGGIGAQKARPGEFFFRNAAMGLHLVEHGRRSGIRKFVYVGTASSYPRDTPVPFREDTLWAGAPDDVSAPYGLSKRLVGTLLETYRKQYGFDGVQLLPINLYGPHDRFDPESGNVVASLIRKYVEAADAGTQVVTAWGTGSPTREFLHVEDCAAGVLLAMDRLTTSEPVNLGTGQEVSIRQLTDLIARLAGFTGRTEWDTARPEGQPRRSLDITRARQLLGFEPRISLETGLQQTIDWYRAARSKGR